MKKNLALFTTIFSGILLFVASCNKDSNELNPYRDEIKFTKTIQYNGNTILSILVTQKIEIGQDSLTFLITNPSNEDIDSMNLLFYVQTGDVFNKTLDFPFEFSILNLASGGETLVKVLNYPELPLEESEIFIRMLHSSEHVNNPLAGFYQGQAGFYFEGDTIPTKFSFLKGFVESDGTSSFWMKLNEESRKLNGQFIDTIDLNALYTIGTNPVTAMLDTIQANTKFLIDPTKIQFITKVPTPLEGIEQKMKLTLFK